MEKLTPKLGNGSHQETESNTTDLAALKTKVQRGAKEELRTPPLPGASLFTREISRTGAGFSGLGWNQNENEVSAKILIFKRYTRLLEEEQPGLNFLHGIPAWETDKIRKERLTDTFRNSRLLTSPIPGSESSQLVSAS